MEQLPDEGVAEFIRVLRPTKHPGSIGGFDAPTLFPLMEPVPFASVRYSIHLITAIHTPDAEPHADPYPCFWLPSEVHPVSIPPPSSVGATLELSFSANFLLLCTGADAPQHGSKGDDFSRVFESSRRDCWMMPF